MKTNKNKVEKFTKKEINRLLKVINEIANHNINKALNSGLISEESDFLKENSLLALLCIEEAANKYKIKSDKYKKEAKNIRFCL